VLPFHTLVFNGWLLQLFSCHCFVDPSMKSKLHSKVRHVLLLDIGCVDRQVYTKFSRVLPLSDIQKTPGTRQRFSYKSRLIRLNLKVISLCLQTYLILAGGLSDCADYQYKTNGDPQCKTCPKCPAGQMYTKNCGFEEKKGVIYKLPNKGGCKDCPPNKYKNERSIFECDECTNTKCTEGKDMIHPCNKTHDLKCSKCTKG
jgi:hypothetical protein